ncbi:hypothetical protein BRC88_02385 [Halobacteriales archaeon QS_4_69_225]|nr:MAG: hypothetical protein BRC88_02385 [Halobacteriales archaeon QS_4_69_225]
MTDDSERTGFSRRTFMRTTGLALGAAGASLSAGSAAAREGFQAEFANWRVQEASKAWERGYRGRPDRSVAVGDSGADGRHPDLSWNGVRIVENGDSIGLQKASVEGSGESTVGELNDGEGYSGTLGPGAADAGVVDRGVHELTVPEDADEVDVTLTWTPQRQDNELLLEDENGNVKASGTDFNPLSGAGERIKAPVEDGDRVVAETYANVAADYEITGEFLETSISLEAFGGDPLPGGDIDEDTPKLVGWKGGTLARDGDGHGSHVSSITAGSGEASAVDESSVVEEEPRTVLLPTDVLEYEVTPKAGHGDHRKNGGVFASVYGENVEIAIEAPDGRTLESTSVTSDSSESGDVTVAEAYAEQSGDYSVYVRPSDTAGTSTARVERVSVGALLPPAATTGSRTGEPTLHAGTAPNASLVTIQGLGNALSSLSEFAGFYTGTFGVRTANFSYGGLPTERVGLGNTYELVRKMAEGGILTVSSAGNNGPLSGSTGPSGSAAAIAVAATDPVDGLTAYTSGGTVARNDEGDVYRKPDLTAPGGTIDDLVNAADVGAADGPADAAVRGYTGKAGTSMAAPYVNGIAGLVANAMEFDAPDALSIAEPAEAGIEDVERLKHVLLATASETAFTAAPHHRAHTPTYDFGDRDPYEGYGRVNPDAAVDAVARELLDASDVDDNGSANATFEETVGLNIPEDSRAVAGFVRTRGGTLEVSVEFTRYAGGNTGLTRGDPHVDLFVYDAEPGTNGEPNVVARAAAVQGSASTSVDVSTAEAGEEPNEETYFVVAKLVNVPGVVNGYDVQVQFDLDVGLEAGEIPDVTTEFTASGSRSDDASVFTAGQTDRVRVTVENFENASEVTITDQVPDGWTVDERYGDVESFDPDSGTVTFQGTVSADQVGDDGNVTLTYFAEAPEGADGTGTYTFGPAEAAVVEPDVPEGDTDGELDGDGTDEFGGTDTNTVVGADTET